MLDILHAQQHGEAQLCALLPAGILQVKLKTLGVLSFFLSCALSWLAREHYAKALGLLDRDRVTTTL